METLRSVDSGDKLQPPALAPRLSGSRRLRQQKPAPGSATFCGREAVDIAALSCPEMLGLPSRVHLTQVDRGPLHVENNAWVMRGLRSHEAIRRRFARLRLPALMSADVGSKVRAVRSDRYEAIVGFSAATCEGANDTSLERRNPDDKHDSAC
jgi:hypothetical protein